MVISTDSAWEDIFEALNAEYDDVVVYADMSEETVLHEGSIRIRTNGWVELPTGRLLSPNSVHHIDTFSGK